MNARNCRKCGKLFNYVSGPPICMACREALEEKFHEVKSYIWEHVQQRFRKWLRLVMYLRIRFSSG